MSYVFPMVFQRVFAVFQRFFPGHLPLFVPVVQGAGGWRRPRRRGRRPWWRWSGRPSTWTSPPSQVDLAEMARFPMEKWWFSTGIFIYIYMCVCVYIYICVCMCITIRKIMRWSWGFPVTKSPTKRKNDDPLINDDQWIRGWWDWMMKSLG